MGLVTKTKFGLMVAENLNNAQILTLHSTPIIITAPTRAGFFVYPIQSVWQMKWFADYSNIDANAQLVLSVGSFANNGMYAAFDENGGGQVSGVLAQGASSVGVLPVLSRTDTTHVFVGGSSGWIPSDMVGQNLEIKLSNGGSGALAGGNAQNELRVTVLFAEIEDFS